MNATTWREEKGQQISHGDKTHWGKEHIWGLRVQDLDPRGWGETHTIPRPCTWGHTFTVSRVIPLPRPCTWSHTSTVSRMTPLPDPVPGVIHPQSLGWPPSPDPAPGVTRPQSLGWSPLPDPAPGVARLLVRTPGLCWLGPYGGNEWVPVTSWLGRSTYRVHLLSPHLSQKNPPLFSLVLCDINCFYSFHDNVEHTTLVFAVSVFCCPAEVLRKHTRHWAGRWGSGLVSAEYGRSTGTRSQQQIATFWLFAWSMCPAIYCPGKPVPFLPFSCWWIGIITR